ncbi:globin [Parvibaculum sp.]|uniref:globin n=1 Tax=Parvibaculum sp. TaxID=2024848 RepID=UPI00320ED850
MSLVMESLEKVGDRVGDPTPLVYERLFSRNPDMKALFVRDANDLVKGEMLAQVIECLVDFTGDRRYAANMIPSELRNHENLGVPPAVFATFFGTVMETFRDILGADWTPEMEREWRQLLAGLDGLIGDLAAAHA